MYTVNVTLLPDYEVTIASGHPSILAYNSQTPGKAPVVTFQSNSYFVLYVSKNGEQQVIITPGGRLPSQMLEQGQ